MVYQRPNRPQPSQVKPSPAVVRNPTQRSDRPNQNGDDRGGNSNRVGSGNGGSGGGNNPPSPWLDHPLHQNGNSPNLDPTASFVEYLRWMRSPNSDCKDLTKVQILQMAQERANYRDRLIQLTSRTKQIAGEGNFFQVKCSWRIRVGGHRGPESILLPAFDALGMPYIPSSTLRGVARTQAIFQFMQTEGMNRKQAEEAVAPYFGSLNAKASDRASKIIFLDAYPLPTPKDKSGGLSVDIANNIWSWEKDNSLKYSPNPNAFLSLKESTFLIGIRPAVNCHDDILKQVQQWLIKGLQDGIGS